MTVTFQGALELVGPAPVPVLDVVVADRQLPRHAGVDQGSVGTREHRVIAVVYVAVVADVAAQQDQAVRPFPIHEGHPAGNGHGVAPP
jgi:hypothetical protein